MFVVNATCKTDNLTTLFMVVNDWCDMVTRLKNFIPNNNVNSKYLIYEIDNNLKHNLRSIITIKDDEYIVCNFVNDLEHAETHSSKNYLEVKSRI